MKTGKSKDHLQRVFLRFLYLIMGSILSLDSVMAQENLKISGQVWGIERSGFFNGREKWAKGFENQRV